MHILVKLFAAILVFIGLATMAFAIMVARDIGGLDALPVILPGVGLVISGALLYCFGEITSQLIAIRSLIQRQLDEAKR